MKGYQYILLILFFILGAEAFSQTATIPDEKFLAFLKQNYPSTINVSDELIIAEAEMVYGSFNCTNQNINNLEGIQYFTSINRLYAGENQLTKLPNISSLKGLITLNVVDNLLTELPDLRQLNDLKEITAYNNKLTVFPIISGLYHLDELTLYNNSIEFIPSYSSLKALKKLDVGGNPISDLSFLNQLNWVRDLRLWGLRITDTPDLSNLIYLENLNLGTNYLSEAPDLSALKNLEIVYLNNNLFKELPKGLLNLRGLKEVHLENNSLSFEDLIPITFIKYYGIIYSFFPQIQVPIYEPKDVFLNTNVKLSVDLNDNTENLKYLWYKGNTFIKKTNSPVLVIKDFRAEDNGKYYCEISTPSVTGFYLKSNTATLNGNTCVDQNSISVKKSQSCEDGNTIEIMVLDHSIFNYQLVSKYDTLNNTSGYFSGLRINEYKVLVYTQNCSARYNELVVLNDLDCSEVLITPDGDGINDSYYFEDNAHIEVFDKSGKKVASFSAPTDWSGHGDNGKLPSGYYLISINGGKSIRMSIVY